MNELARPKKDGLEYFPLDVAAGKDDELELVESEHGLVGFAIFIKLLQSIYKSGYYLEWTKKEQLIFSKRVNAAETIVNAVITSCLEWGLFNQQMYDKYKILTSHGIQQRFIFAIGRRSAMEIYEEYLLLTKNEVSATKTLVIVTKTEVNASSNPKSKVKKIESKKKEKESSSEEDTAATNIKRIATMLESTFGRMPSQYEIEMLTSYIEDGMEIELIEKSLTETIENGVRNLKYTKSILERCTKEKILTLNQYIADQELKKEQKKVKGNGANNTGPNTEDSEPVEDEFAKYAEQHGIQ